MFRNFAWTCNLNNKKLVIVGWKPICSPISRDGIGLRSLLHLNDSSNIKLCWEMINSNDRWVVFLKRRFYMNNSSINYHIFSPIWSVIKPQLQNLMSNSKWLLGIGSKINFWNKNWTEDSTFLFILPKNFNQRLKIIYKT